MIIQTEHSGDATNIQSPAMEEGIRPPLREHAVIVCLAVGATALIVIRACIQNITIDEALSYLSFASREYSFTQWFPHSANHVLNSLLMRLVTSIFGINELTVRSPALFGGIVYIASSAYLAVRLTQRKLLQWSLFVCLVLNPFILDYLVAARGYGLAAGFLSAAIAVIANAMLAERRYHDAQMRASCISISILLALSFSANFSFGIADATIALFYFAWAVMHRGKVSGWKYARLAAECFGPGILTAFVLSGAVVLKFPRGQLYFGSNSLSEMWIGLGKVCFGPLNQDLVNPILIRWLTPVQKDLPWVVVVTLFLLLISGEARRLLRHRVEPDRLLTFVRFLAGVTLATFLLHWALFRTVHLLLPKDRTALFFVLFATLSFGGALALRFRSAKRDAIRVWGVGVLIAMALSFIGCLRLGYFSEWIFDADTKQLYWLANDLHNRCGISDFGVDWRYNVSMNFYREAYNNFSIREFGEARSDQLPPNKDAYVIYLPTSQDFIRQQKLQVIYHNDQSGSSVAIRSCPVGAAQK
jgi:hypothetical protein